MSERKYFRNNALIESFWAAEGKKCYVKNGQIKSDYESYKAL